LNLHIIEAATPLFGCKPVLLAFSHLKPWNSCHSNDAFRLGNFEEAERLYSEALRLHPDNMALYTNRAQARLRVGRYLEAVDDCGWALRLDERNVKAHLRMGLALQQLGRYDEALQALEKARKASPAKNRPEIAAHAEETRRLQRVAADEIRVIAAEQKAVEMAGLVRRLLEETDAAECASAATELADILVRVSTRCCGIEYQCFCPCPLLMVPGPPSPPVALTQVCLHHCRDPIVRIFFASREA